MFFWHPTHPKYLEFRKKRNSKIFLTPHTSKILRVRKKRTLRFFLWTHNTANTSKILRIPEKKRNSKMFFLTPNTSKNLRVPEKKGTLIFFLAPNTSKTLRIPEKTNKKFSWVVSNIKKKCNSRSFFCSKFQILRVLEPWLIPNTSKFLVSKERRSKLFKWNPSFGNWLNKTLRHKRKHSKNRFPKRIDMTIHCFEKQFFVSILLYFLIWINTCRASVSHISIHIYKYI